MKIIKWCFVLVLLSNGDYVNTNFIYYMDLKNIYFANMYKWQSHIQSITKQDYENIKAAMGVYDPKDKEK